MLTAKELRDLSGKNTPEEDYENYCKEHTIPQHAKGAPRGFLHSPEAVNHDANEAANEDEAIHPHANRFAYLYGYMKQAYDDLWHDYQKLINDTIRQQPCTCQQARNGD